MKPWSGKKHSVKTPIYRYYQPETIKLAARSLIKFAEEPHFGFFLNIPVTPLSGLF